MNVVPDCPIDNNQALVWIMAWRLKAIVWTDADPIQWRIYAAIGGDEINALMHLKAVW